MKIIRNLNNTQHSSDYTLEAGLKYYNNVVALGNFDGVHLGHVAVISKAIEIAQKENKPSAVMSFDPHPLTILHPDITNFSLTNAQQKLQLIENTGVDFVFLQDFTKEFAQVSAQNFVEKILIEKLRVSHIVIGNDFIFGHKRSGNAQMLRDMAKQNGFKITQLPEITDGDNNRFSSSAIRKNIMSGNINAAISQLGHDFIIEGQVIKGKQLGQTIGIPTANIGLGNYVHPKFGAYHAEVLYGGRWYKAVCNIGVKPTVENNNITLLEAHILDFNQDIYDQNIAVKLIKFLRPEKKFDNIDQLKQQIYLDIQDCC